MNVAPRVGAWIETYNDPIRVGRSQVAPRVEAWIETMRADGGSRRTRVAPRVGAWIETISMCVSRPAARVAPRAGPSRGLRGQATAQPLVHFYAAAPVHFYAAVDSHLRQRRTGICTGAVDGQLARQPQFNRQNRSQKPGFRSVPRLSGSGATMTIPRPCGALGRRSQQLLSPCQSALESLASLVPVCTHIRGCRTA